MTLQTQSSLLRVDTSPPALSPSFTRNVSIELCAFDTFQNRVFELHKRLSRAERADEMVRDIQGEIKELKKQNNRRTSAIEQLYSDMQSVMRVAEQAPELRSEIDVVYMHMDIALGRQERNISYTECNSPRFQACIEKISKELSQVEKVIIEEIPIRRKIDSLQRQLANAIAIANEELSIKMQISFLKLQNPVLAKEKEEIRKKLQMLDQKKDLVNRAANQILGLRSQLQTEELNLQEVVKAVRIKQNLKKRVNKIKRGGFCRAHNARRIRKE